MIYTIEEISRRIAPVAKKHNLPSVFLFGSYARGTATEESDIDLIVDTTGTSIKGLFSLGALYHDLEVALEKKIDMITVQSLQQSPQMPSEEQFKKQVIKERVELYAVACSRLARKSWHGIRVSEADAIPFRIPVHPCGAYIRWGIDSRH